MNIKSFIRQVAVLAVIFVAQVTQATPRSPLPPMPEFARVSFSERFDADYYSQTRVAEIDSAGLGKLVESWSGYALQRAGDVTPFVIPGVDGSRTNLYPNGAARLWVKPYWASASTGDGKGMGHEVVLLEMSVVGKSEVAAVWSLRVSADGSDLYLWSGGGNDSVVLLKTDIAWRAGEWHQVVLNYGKKETSLAVDGEIVAAGGGAVTLPSHISALTVGSNLRGGESLGGEIEDVYCFARALKFAFHYEPYRGMAALGPISAEELAYRQELSAKLKAARAAKLKEEEESGGGMMLRMAGPANNCVTNGPVYLTNVVCNFTTNEGWTLMFDIAGGTNGVIYDLFSTPELKSNSVWTWLETAQVCETHSFTNQATNQMFYTILTPGMDRDADGMYDGWELKHFGTLEQAPDGDYDGDGISNRDAHAVGYGPNNIAFSLELTNQYVRSVSVPMGVNLQRGIPASVAVLVDNTNLAAANWTEYTPNLTVSLPAVEGWHEVRVGLRGHFTGNTAWRMKRLKYDITSPVLAITNPAVATISQPLVQVQGYANESVASVIFALTNAAGTLTNQSGFVTFQSYDTNSFEFTTNYFQCYDLQLTNGANTITLQITDLAGNTATTNVTVTLDGSGDTTPPTINLMWPQTGVRLSGDSFTVNGFLNDPSATLTAFLVSSNGVTNSVSGIVGRSGEFWVENVPVDAGTNQLYLAATDFWGNAATTNIPLIKSAIVLMVDALTSEQMKEFFTTVTGTIGNTNQDVWVNGVLATVSNGVWQADSVPLTRNKTVSLHVKTVPTGSDPNTTPSTAELRTAQDAPPLLEVSSYHTKSFWKSGRHIIYPILAMEDVNTLNMNWVENTGGDFYHRIVSTPIWYGLWPGTPTNCTTTANLPAALWDAAQPLAASGNCYGGGPITLALSGRHANSVSGDNREQTDAQTALKTNSKDTAGEVNVYRVKLEVTENNVPIAPEKVLLQGRVLAPSAEDANVGEVILQTLAGVDISTTPQVPGSDSYNWSGTVEQIKAALLVDANRDGSINEQDRHAVTSFNPFRFWINDDKDNGDVADSDSDIPGATVFQNWNNSVVNGRCDVIDFFPVWLSLSNVLQQLPLTNGYSYRLSHAAGAVNFVYTDLARDNGYSYLTNLNSLGYGTAFDKATHEADTIHVTAAGVELSADFLNRCLTNDNKGVILVEGRTASTSPLKLDIWRNGQKLGGIPLPLRLDGVEMMFRHLNLTGAAGVPAGPGQRLDSLHVPNEPPTSGKNFVFLHGYNVNPDKARAWESDVFKRLYCSGSRAKFWGVTWHGSESQVFGITPHYHTNVVNVFLSAPYLKDFIAGLSGETIISGHSLGNMVCLSAINDYGASPAKYFMINAAVPIEAIDGSLESQTSMIHPEWVDYTNRLWASKWHTLFNANTNDGRNVLSWNNRLANFGSVNVYNFYSSGEEVLREDPNAPPSGLLTTFYQNALNFFAGQAGLYAWVWQEKTKGIMAFNGVSGSDHGGWEFNSYYNTCPNSICGPRPPADAALLTDIELQTNAFFDLGDYTFSDHPDLTYLPSANGSGYAQTNRNRILSDAIPALTLPIGANVVTNLNVIFGENRNFDMQNFKNDQNDWPQRPPAEAGNWHHSDIRDVAYPYNHRIFDQFVNTGNLR